MAESFFATIKNELIHRFKFDNRREATSAIFEYIDVLYNRIRKHSKLGYASPDEFRRTHQPAAATLTRCSLKRVNPSVNLSAAPLPSNFRIKAWSDGHSTVKYRDEESILENVDDVKKYNDEIILPDKIGINWIYLQYFSIRADILCILKTLKLVK